MGGYREDAAHERLSLLFDQMKKVKKYLLPLILVGVMVVAVTFVLWLRAVKTPALVASPSEPYFNCLYKGSWGYARCLSKDSPLCYGYYYLKTANIRDGIDTNQYSNTCEGLVGGDKYNFNVNGERVP